MNIILNRSSMVPVYEQITGFMKSEIIHGGLRAGDMLPSVRTLAAQMQISARTVKKAYDRLEEEGFIVTVHGKGSFVAQADTAMAEEARRREAEATLSQAVESVRAAGLTDEEIRTLVDIILEE